MIDATAYPHLLSDVRDGFTALTDDAPSLSSCEARKQWLIDYARVRNQADALFELVLADVMRNQDYKADGSLSIVPWLGWKLRIAPYDAKRMAATARRLERHHLTEEALQQGDISLDAAVHITRTMDQLGGDEAFTRNPDENGELMPTPQQILIGSARDELPRHFREACETMKFRYLPGKAERDTLEQLDQESVHLSQVWDGMWRIDGMLCPEHGTLVKTALDALMGPRKRGERRSASERRAAALVEAMDHLLTAGEVPEAGGERPHLALVTDLASLREEPGGAVSILDYTGQPIPGKVAQRLACDCHATLIVKDEKGDVLHVGRRQRTFTPQQRKALALRDGGCAWPDCDRPPSWTDGHHLVPWWLGGSTDIENGALLCKAHHTMVHDKGWTLSRNPDTGRFDVAPP